VSDGIELGRTGVTLSEPDRPEPAALTRRAAIVAMAAGLGAAGISGCGSAARPRLRRMAPGIAAHDVTAVNLALAAEQRSIAFYAAAAPLLSGVDQLTADRLLDDDNTHAGKLHRMVVALGGHPHRPAPRYDFPVPRTAGEILRVMHELEREQIRSYQRAIPAVSAGAVRQTLGAILANDAQHLLLIEIRQGRRHLPGPFPMAALTAG
jgi:rubrerythrin